MTMKRNRNANNANGAVEFLDDGTVQVSDKTDRTKKLVLDASQVASGGSVNVATAQQVQDGAAGKASYAFTASTSNVTSILSSPAFFGTGELTLLFSGTTKATSAAESLLFVLSYTTTQFSIRQNANTYNLVCKQNADTGYASSVLGTAAQGKPYSFAVTRVGSLLTGYMNGAVSGTRTTGGTDDLTGIGSVYVGHPTVSWNGSATRAIAFNYALTEDKIRRYSAGAKLDYEDVGGSMTELITNGTLEGTYSSGVAPSWTKMNVSDTFADETSLMHSGSHCQKITWVAGGDSGIYTSITLPAVGKRIRATAWVRANRAGVVFVLQTLAAFTSGGSYTVQQANTWEKATFEGVVVTTGATVFYVYVDVGQQSGDIYYIDDVSVVQIGAVLDLEPENITDTMWVDASPNGLHGTVSGAIANRFVPSYSSRNYIINGAIDFYQRIGTGGFVDVSSGSSAYGVDRWGGTGTFTGGGQIRLELSSNVPSSGLFKWSVKATQKSFNASTITGYYLYQKLELAHIRPLIGKQVTLSFWVYASSGVLGTWAAQIVCAGASTLTKTFSVSTATTWQQVTLTFNLPTGITNTNETDYGITVAIGPNVGSVGLTSIAQNEYFILTGIMLSEGPTAAPFERAGGSIGGELALCQRYFSKSSGIGSAITSENSYSHGKYLRVQFPVRMSKTPTLYTVSDGVTTPTVSPFPYTRATAGNYTDGSAVVSDWGFIFTATQALLDAYAVKFGWQADAEL